eukprot:CAMPEP_0116918262 /NCGR_PEP_ID=MMETSP0467-20121206/19659_1 /TAXON_ID=283647 /ORGANISM="Mesodinium pulex, Strain SPMC105" /LENGTH=93 /DNA_ID=CAMNT_0004595563 /DNA_START=252 /DNA_END=533 /DNA_ORIENTATION=+
MLRKALEDQKSIPKGIRGDAKNLLKSLQAEDEETKNLKKEIDEYEEVGLINPKIMLTTSREPSQRLGCFVKELKLVFPDAIRVNRGNVGLSDI